MSDVLEELPETLKIGFATYQVEVVPKGTLKSPEGINSLGICEDQFLTIRLADEQIDTNAKNTFIHELLHAIYNSQGLPDVVDEETAVTSLTNGLMAALQDNVDLQVWWVNHLCEDIDYT